MNTTTEHETGKESGVTLAQVNKECLDAAIAFAGVKVNPAASTALKVQRLSQHFEASGKELMDCDVCGGTSDVDYVTCPYCHDGEPGVPASFVHGDGATTSEAAAVAPVVPPAPPSEALPDPEPEPEPEPEPVQAAPVPPPPASATAVAAPKRERKKREKPQKPQTELALTPEVKPAPAPAKANGHTNGTVNGHAATKPASLAKATPHAVAPAPVVEAEFVPHANESLTPAPALDKVLAEIRAITLQGELDFRATTYRIGQKLWQIHERDLWKLRKSEQGVAYKTFGQFLQKEVPQFGERYAFEIMRVANAFTEKQFLAHGSKLIAVAKVDSEEVRERLLEQAKGGASIRALLNEARKNKPAKAANAKDHSRTQKQKTAAQKPGTITVAAVIGTKHTSKAYKKGKEEEAKRLGDTPWGFFDLTNDVRVFATLVETQHGLRFKFAVERVKTDKE